MTLQPEQVIAQRYWVVKHLGSGGMASVYQVWDRERTVHLALKMLRPELACSSELTAQFQREAHHLETLSHPNIVRFYELIWDGDDAFLAMDFVDGQTLRQEMDCAGGPLSMTRVREILQPICLALNYAHNQGVIHCDLTPSNILIDQAGNPKISDFGIAHVVRSMRDADILTGAGSPAYMAPEQVRKQTPCPQTDIYSLGVLLYEMLTGRRPFYGRSAPATISQERERIAWEKLNVRPDPPSQVDPRIPASIDTVMMRCLNPQLAYRYASALDMFNEFEKAFTTHETERSWDRQPRTRDKEEAGRQLLYRQRAVPFFKKNFKIWVALTMVVVILLVGFFALMGRINGLVPFSGSTKKTVSSQTVKVYSYPLACMTFNVPNKDNGWALLIECVDTIQVLPDGKLKVFVSWTAHSVSTSIGVKVGADTNNPNMYLTDNLGNRLNHIETGEGANETVELANGQSKKGWFLFPAPVKDAQYLFFHDDDNGGATTRLEHFH